MKTKEQIVNDIVKETAKIIPQITNYNTGGVFRLFIEVAASFLAKIYEALDALQPNRFLQTATGQYLDWKAEELGLFRREAGKTRGYIILSRTDASGNVSVDAGKIAASKPDSKGIVRRYVLPEKTILLEGQYSTTALVEAEEDGAAYNIMGGRITEMTTPISGIDTISNTNNWISQPGRDREDDDSLRLRCLALWRGLSGANKDAYISWAKSVEGIGEVKVIPIARGSGTIDVICTGLNNSSPNEKLLDTVRAVIEEKRPIATDVLVKAPSELTVNLGMNVRFLPSADLNKQAVEDAVYQYFGALGIGQDFEPSALIGDITSISGVKGVDVLSPSSVVISDLQIARLGALTITTSNDRSE